MNLSADFSTDWVKMMLWGVEEIVGPEDASRIAETIRLSRTEKNYLPQMQSTLQEMYGPRGGQGVALRAGQAAFKALLRQRGLQMGLLSPQFRLLPTRLRIRTGLEALAGQLEQMWDRKVTVGEDARWWTWRMEDCPLCAGHQASSPACFYIVGFLQGFLSWTVSGKNYLVVEKECLAAGSPACLLLIDQNPVEG